MKIMSFFILALLFLPSGASGQARKPAGIAELVSYRAPDREAILYAGAKSEGKIIWYTSLAGDSYKELVKAFEAKYPGVKVDSYRAAGAELVVRLEEEAKARRNIADTIETTEGSLIFLRDEKFSVPTTHPISITILKTARNARIKILSIGASRGKRNGGRSAG